MRKTLFFIVFLVGLSGAQVGAQTQAEEKTLQEAKILMFDEQWEEAQIKLEELLTEHPRSRLVPQAIFYRAKCLGRQGEKKEGALRAYEDYLFTPDKNESLVEEAETSIIDLAFDLYGEDGDKEYLDKIEERLLSPSAKVRCYAALKLSLVRDKKIAGRAIPVLKQVIAREIDMDLKDRARIALLRISPDSLKEMEDSGERKRAKILRIQVMERGMDEPAFKLGIPWALADLALSAIPEKDKAALREEGYDLDKIVDQLIRMRGNIIEIRSKETPARVIKIWIE